MFGCKYSICGFKYTATEIEYDYVGNCSIVQCVHIYTTVGLYGNWNNQKLHISLISQYIDIKDIPYNELMNILQLIIIKPRK